MSKVYPKKVKPPRDLTIEKLVKNLAAIDKRVEAQRRTIIKLDKANKYLRDRMSNAEQKLNYFTRVISILENNVNKVMRIFRN